MPTSIKKPKVLFIGPYPPPYSGAELGMKLFLESHLKDIFQIKFLNTNVRKSNASKGRFDWDMIRAFGLFIFRLICYLSRFKPKVVYYPVTATEMGWIGRDVWCLFLCRVFGTRCVIHLRGGHLKLNYSQFHPLIKKIVKSACKSVRSVMKS